MAFTVQNLRFRVRAGLAAAVAALNEIPMVRELIFETDTRKAKLGDGVTHYNSLPLVIDPTTQITCVFDGGGAEIEVGKQADVRMPFACTITKATLLADQTGDVVIDVWKSTYSSFPPTDGNSITASAPPTIAANNKSEDTTLTGWTLDVAAGSVLRFNVDLCDAIQHATLLLQVTRK